GFLGINLLFGEVHNCHIGSLARKEHGDCPADTGIPSSNERDQVCKFPCSFIKRSAVARFGGHFGFDAGLVLALSRHRRFGLCLDFLPHCARSPCSSCALCKTTAVPECKTRKLTQPSCPSFRGTVFSRGLAPSGLGVHNLLGDVGELLVGISFLVERL